MSKHALAIMFAISASLAASAARAAASDYIPLEYIYLEGGAAYGQSAATHFIDTGVVPSGDWTITASFASTNTTGASGIYSCLFCARGDGNANPLALWPFIGSSGHEGESRIDIGSRNTPGYQFQSGPATIQPCVKHLVEIKESSSGNLAGYIDRDRKTLEIAQFGSSVCPLYLFSAYTGASDGTVSSVKFSFEGWFYGLKASDGDGKLQLDLVPAKRASDGVVGVYDAANDTFYTNGNANYAFAAGPATGLGVASVSKVSGSYVPVVTNGFAGVATAGTDYTFAVTANAVGAKTMAVTGAGTYAGCQASARFQTLLDSAQYLELDGISMTGASYIIPQIGGEAVVPHGDWTIEMGFVLAQKLLFGNDYDKYACLFSARLDNSKTGNAIMFWNNTSNNDLRGRLGRFDYQGNVGLPSTNTVSTLGFGTYKENADAPVVLADIPLSTAYGKEHVFKIEGGVQSLDGGIVYDASIGGSGEYSSSCGTNFVCGGSLTLFTASTAGTPNANHAAAGTFRYLAVKNGNGADVLKMIPAKRVSDGVAGVYDVVNRTFYPSATETAFTAGAEAMIPEQSSGLLIFVR